MERIIKLKNYFLPSKTGELIQIKNKPIYISHEIIITDAFMRETLQPKEKMEQIAGRCYLSLLSWKIANNLLKTTFNTKEFEQIKIAIRLIFASIARERIQTFDPLFISNAILEHPKKENFENTIYTDTLCNYISEDILVLYKNHITLLSTEELTELTEQVFKEYQKTIQKCVTVNSDITYIPDAKTTKE